MAQRFRKILGAALLAGTLAGMTATALFAQEKKAAPDSTMPKVGDVAPDFKLHYFDGNDLKDVTLSQYRGKKNVVLAFYIFAFTGG
jgi:peroxiredoxin